MAYDNQDFIQKLRQNQVLPPQGRGNPSPLIGMPNFFTGRQPEQPINIAPPVQSNLPQEQPFDWKRGIHFYDPKDDMASAWKPGAADINAGRIVTGETPNEVTGRALALQQNKNALGYGNLAVKSRAQDLKELIQSGRATDAEKQEYQKELISARGDESMEQINRRGEIQGNLLDTRGSQQTGLQELRGNQGKELQDIRGSQILDQIAKRALLKDKADDENILSPSQLRNQTNNNLQKIMLQEPELAKYLIKDPNTGQYSISPDADAETRSRINQRINGESVGFQQDINLPAKNTTPTSSTPKADMSLPSQSKYKVTVK